MRTIDITGRSREELLIIAERACSFIVGVANAPTTAEGDVEATEEITGLSVAEAVEMEHDSFIETARRVLDSIGKDFPKTGDEG